MRSTASIDIDCQPIRMSRSRIAARKRSSAAGIVEIRRAEVFERPVLPRLLAQRGKSQPNRVGAFVGSPRRIPDDFHDLTLRLPQAAGAGRDGHHGARPT